MKAEQQNNSTYFSTAFIAGVAAPTDGGVEASVNANAAHATCCAVIKKFTERILLLKKIDTSY